MKFIPVDKANLNWDDTYLAQLNDGSHVLAKIDSQDRDGYTFLVGDIESTEPWKTRGVSAVAKLPKTTKGDRSGVVG